MFSSKTICELDLLEVVERQGSVVVTDLIARNATEARTLVSLDYEEIFELISKHFTMSAKISYLDDLSTNQINQMREI